jgi:voltage-gated potassium channel
VVNFMDQMLRSDEGLRVEEVVVPTDHAPTPAGALLPRSRDYILVATQEQGRWVFNPADEHLVQPGTVLVLMASPQGRANVESLFHRGG